MWTDDFYGREDDYLEESTRAAINIIASDGEEFATELEERRMRLPGRDGMERQIWRSRGADLKIPVKVKPISQSKEKELISSIIAEIREKQAINMDPSPSFERGLGLQMLSKIAVDYLLVGSSNASKLKLVLQKMGKTTSMVFLTNWRIEMGSVAALAVMTRDAVRHENPDTVILQLLDSSFYYGKTMDGGRYPPRKL
jgi:hypothetical protein